MPDVSIYLNGKKVAIKRVESEISLLDEMIRVRCPGKRRIKQKASLREHALVHPVDHIGSVDVVKQTMRVFDAASNRMVCKEISYVPGLFEIFDNILMFVAGIENVSRIAVRFNTTSNEISIRGDGSGIPFVKKNGKWVASIDFGSKFELTTIYSREFLIQTVSGGVQCSQKWKKNMEIQNDAESCENSMSTDCFKVTFIPDLTKFKMTTLDDNDTIALMRRRAIDIAGIKPGISVYLDDTKLAVRSFEDYVRLFAGDEQFAYQKVNANWEIAAALLYGSRR